VAACKQTFRARITAVRVPGVTLEGEDGQYRSRGQRWRTVALIDRGPVRAKGKEGELRVYTVAASERPLTASARESLGGGAADLKVPQA
jgi:hypothetical protein